MSKMHMIMYISYQTQLLIYCRCRQETQDRGVQYFTLDGQVDFGRS